MKSRVPRSAARRTARAVLVAVLMVGSFVLPANVANAGIGLGVTPTFPDTVAVSDQNRPASLQISNQNTPPNNAESNTLLSALLSPACGDPLVNAPCPVASAEPGVFLIDAASAVGRPGTACAGISFTVTGPDATGTYTFTPTTPVILGPPGTPVGGDRCIIDFTFDVAKAPTIDVNPARPGRQTFATARANAVVTISGLPASGSGAAEIEVVPTTAVLGTVASAAGQTVTPGTPVNDTATVSGPVGSPVPTGTVTFTLRGPGGCAGAVVGAPQTVLLAGGTATSPGFTGTAPGTYNFTATYSGDANYRAITVPVGCGVPDEMFTVAAVAPTVRVDKTASPLSRPEPGGDFTYTVVITNTSTVEPLTITSLVDSVYGDLTTRSISTCTTAIGWVLAVAPGPRNTYTCQFAAPFTGPPGSLTDVVTVVGVDDDGQTATDSDDATVTITALPTIDVQKTASPLTLPEPGGSFTYTVVVTNTSTVEPLRIISLTDNVYGDLTTRSGSTCTTAIGTVLAVTPGPGNTFTCTFAAPFNGNAGASLTDVVTVRAINAQLVVVTDTDDAVVSLTPVAPTVRVDKTANPLSRPEPGGAFTYTVVITNTSTVEPLTITSLVDDVYGNLATRSISTCTTAVGTVLAVAPGPGNTYTCQFAAPFNGLAGASLTDVVTVTGVDDDGQTATDTDDATVTITGSADLSITKTCDPGPVAPGAVVNCSITVANAGPSTAQNVSVTDDLPAGVTLVGTPGGGGFTCGTGDPFTCTRSSLAANTSAALTFSVQIVNVSPGASLVNTATVSSTTPDPGPGPNTATATTSVVMCTITGAGDITGTEGNDVICGSAGPDRIAGLGGNDVIFGLGGDDQLSGGDGNDVLLGGDGNDDLSGGNGNDQLFGGPGALDRLSGGAGDDLLNTVDGSGGDFAVGGDHVVGDTCVVDPGDFTALCEGANGANPLPPTTTTTAPAPTTTTTVPSPTTTTTVPTPTTTTTVPAPTTTTTTPTPTTTTTTTTTVPTPTTTTTVPSPTTTTTVPPTTGTCGGFTPTIVGTSGDDVIVGTPGRDVIAGGGGNDRIFGLGGDDVICGGAGNDQILGGDGNDTIFGDDGDDQLLGENGNDRIVGGAGNDLLVGGAGDDSIDGGADVDRCFGDAGTDSASACESASGVP